MGAALVDGIVSCPSKAYCHNQDDSWSSPSGTPISHPVHRSLANTQSSRQAVIMPVVRLEQAMYVRLENFELLTKRTFHEVQRAILKHKDFLDALQGDSDWAFVIKIHAFLEALLTSLIRSHSGDFKLGGIASRLPMSSSDGISKLELVKANALLSPEQMRFIKRIGEVRNLLAHEVGMVDSFLFSDYISKFDGNQLKNWRRDMTYFLAEDKINHLSDVAVAEPRSLITEALLDLICQIEGSMVLVDITSESHDVGLEDTKQLVDSLVEKLGIEVETRTHSVELDGHS
jgi:hypothetical protein